MKTVGRTFIFGFCIVFFAVIGVGAYIFSKIPSEKEIKGCIVTTMYQVELCPGSKNYVPLKSISPYLQKTIVLTEDSAFFQHDGFDWKAIEENAKKNMEKGKYAKGGSTISQQLAKNMFLYKDKTLIRKGLEAIITYKIEHTLNKKEILERYLNVVEFGKDIYGVKAAASHYFKKTPAQLDVVESAFLAMILPNPIKYSQSYYKKELTPFAHRRIKQIVENLFQYNRITEDEYFVAMDKVSHFLSPNAPSAFDSAIDELDKAFQGQDNNTTLDELNDLENDEGSFF